MACAFVFMGVKYVEYKAKWEHGLLWARSYDPHIDHAEAAHGAADEEAARATAAEEPGSPAPAPSVQGLVLERSTLAPAAQGPRGLAATPSGLDDHGEMAEPANAQIFFSIYFLMTGLHGLHVVIGMILIAGILVRSLRGAFSSAYFTPVDLVGLYWHLVDLIWIFLFPLLYLIH